MKNKIQISVITLAIFMSTNLNAGEVFSGTYNVSTGDNAVIAGGINNKARSRNSFIGGGSHNDTVSINTSILGGERNRASYKNSTIGGGFQNKTSGYASTVSGGSYNHAIGTTSTISGGQHNSASGKNASVAGGRYNSAMGENSFAMGMLNATKGKQSIAIGTSSQALKDNSIAIGTKVQAYTKGSMVIGDSNRDNKSLAERNGRWEDRFYAYFRRGYVLNTSGYRSDATGVYLEGGDGAWNTVSDKNKKENYTKIDKQKILDKLIVMPIEQWNYTAQEDNITHIGPYAQDFNKAYGLGDGKLSINTIDSDGIALASIQALAERNTNLQKKNKELLSRVERLETQFSKLAKELQ